MREERLYLPTWDALTRAEREDVARAVSREHPRFQFLDIRRHAQGDQVHEVAFFDWSGIEFALTPGAEIDLGYDPAHPWVPRPEEREGYEELRINARQGSEYRQTVPGPGGQREFALVVPPGEMLPLEDYIQEYLTRLRHVRIDPLLLEVLASRAGIRHLEPGERNFDPSMADNLLPGIGGCSRFVDGVTIQYRLDRDGTLRIWEERAVSHAEILGVMAAEGFRLPTSDEWEYACGAGLRTLFRWGDHSPPEYYDPGPLAVSEAERREAMEDLERFVEMFHHRQDNRRDFDNPAIQPNAFGLLMTDGSNDAESCMEAGIMRGGDSGFGACGGMDLFTACWLPQATAFFFECSGADTRRIRRTFPLVERV